MFIHILPPLEFGKYLHDISGRFEYTKICIKLLQIFSVGGTNADTKIMDSFGVGLPGKYLKMVFDRTNDNRLPKARGLTVKACFEATSTITPPTTVTTPARKYFSNRLIHFFLSNMAIHSNITYILRKRNIQK